MVPGCRTSSIAIPRLTVTTSWARSAKLPTGCDGGAGSDDVGRLVGGGSTSARDQTLTQSRITHGAQPVLDEQDVVVGVAVHRVEH